MTTVDHVRTAKSALYAALRSVQSEGIEIITRVERAIIVIELLEADLILGPTMREGHST